MEKHDETDDYSDFFKDRLTPEQAREVAADFAAYQAHWKKVNGDRREMVLYALGRWLRMIAEARVDKEFAHIHLGQLIGEAQLWLKSSLFTVIPDDSSKGSNG